MSERFVPRGGGGPGDARPQDRWQGSRDSERGRPVGAAVFRPVPGPPVPKGELSRRWERGMGPPVGRVPSVAQGAPPVGQRAPELGKRERSPDAGLSNVPSHGGDPRSRSDGGAKKAKVGDRGQLSGGGSGDVGRDSNAWRPSGRHSGGSGRR